MGKSLAPESLTEEIKTITLPAPECHHSTGALGDAGSRTQRGQFWKVVMRDDNPGNPPAGYQELQDPELHRVRSLLAMHLQRRLSDGGSLAEVVDLCGPHTGISHDVPKWGSVLIDVDIAGIVSSNTAVSVELSLAGLDEGHTVWCMPDSVPYTPCSITPPAQPSGGLRLDKAGGQAPAGEASVSEDGSNREAKRKRPSGRSAGGSDSSSNKAKLQQLELRGFAGLCQEFEMLRENVKGDGNCMPSSVAQGMLWCDHILRDEGGKLRRTDREELSLSIRTEAVEWCLQNSADFKDFFVFDATSKGDTGPQDGVRGKSALEWSVSMKNPGIFGDDLLLQCIARKLEKKIQVFYYDKKSNGMRMKILFSRELTKEESARLQPTENKPRASDFEDDSILRLALTQHQCQGSAHYENIIANKVCERSIGAFLLPGTQLVGIFSCFSRIHDCLMHMTIVRCT
jgi:OTU-like cysteine protease